MKKELSILLLFCFFFYHFGYYLFYFSYKFKIESDWASAIHDDTHDLEEAQLINIPLTIPYMVDQEEFQEANSSFEKRGKSYRVVKQRYLRDTLQIVYVPDVASNRLDHTIKGWISFLNDGIEKETTNGKIIVKNFLKDFLQPLVLARFNSRDFLHLRTIAFLFVLYVDVNIDQSYPPPEIA